jgi:hypothetical protein
MKSFFKKSAALLLIVTVFAPWVYFGTLPPKQVEAADGCGFTAMLQAGITAVKLAIDAIEGIIDTANGVQAVNAASGAVGALGIVATIQNMFGQAIGDIVGDPANSVTPLIDAADAVGSMTGTVVNFLQTKMEGLIADMSLNAAATTAASAQSLTFKECILDPLAWLFKNIVIEQITQDIIAWINGGFEGAPAFITDPMSFMQGIGDAATGLFLFESGLDEYLCSPFQIDVIVDFYLNYSTPSFSEFGNMACTLDDVFANVAAGPNINAQVNAGYDQMVRQGNLDFDGGGFNAVFKTLEDQNNPYGTYFNLQSEAAARTHTFQAKENQLLVQGDGWFSLRCDLDGDGGNDNVCTPGQYVSKSVDNWSDSALSQLEAADELAEIIDALVSTLVQKTLSDVGTVGTGLLGGGDPANWATSNATRANFDTIASSTRAGFGNIPPIVRPPAPFNPRMTMNTAGAHPVGQFNPPSPGVALSVQIDNPADVASVQFYISIPNPVATIPAGPPTIRPIGLPLTEGPWVVALNSALLPEVTTIQPGGRQFYTIYAVAKNAAGVERRSINSSQLGVYRLPN